MRTEILIALIKIRHYMGEELFQNRRLAGTLEEALGEILGNRYVGEVGLMLRLYVEGYPQKMYVSGATAAYWIDQEARTFANRYYLQEAAVKRALASWYFLSQMTEREVNDVCADETGAALAVHLTRFCKKQPSSLQKSLLAILGHSAAKDFDHLQTTYG